MSQIPPPFLGENERIMTSLQSEDWGLYVTNWRLVFQRMESKKSRTVFDYDYKYISHIKCESKSGEDLRSVGIFLTIIGFLLIVIGYNYYGGTSFMFIGVLLLIGGIAALFSKTNPTTTLSIQLSGVTDTKTITLGVTAEQIDKILKSLAEMREKTTLRHDSILEFSEQE